MTPNADSRQGFTPTYQKLWHRDFSLLMVAHLLIAMAPCYMACLLPTMLGDSEMKAENMLLLLSTTVLGVLTAGLRINNLVQRYRRKRVFAVSVLVLAIGLVVFEYLYSVLPYKPLTLAVAGFVTGASYCLAQRVLACTLVVDKTEAFHRTEANYVSAWISRFGVALGMLLALVFGRSLQFQFVCTPALGFLFVALGCVALVKIPFKAPEERVPRLSFDRFFLSSGCWLFGGRICLAVVMGLIFATCTTPLFYAMLLPGCLLGILCERISWLRRVQLLTLGACLCIVLALVAIQSAMTTISLCLAPMILGMSMGLAGTRVLLRLLYQSEHCQRSSAMSTYFLAWDLGFVVGLALGWLDFMTMSKNFMLATTVLSLAAALVCFHDDKSQMKRPEDARRFIGNDTNT